MPMPSAKPVYDVSKHGLGDANAVENTGGAWEPAQPPRHRVLKAFLRNPNAVAGLVLLSIIIAGALLAPVIYPGDPQSMVARPFMWPGQSMAYPLGTDSMGRDITAGILHGARISLGVGFAATALSLTLGVLIGATAGYFGGWIDDLIVRFIEIFQTMPGFLLLVVIVAIAQSPSMTIVIVAIAIVSWDTIARLTRAEFRSIREKDFVMAARASGYGNAHIIFHQILPNALPPLIVASSLAVASAILMESALAFMGLGDPNAVSWGLMIGQGRELIRSAWYLTAVPGIAIVITVLALNLLGDGLNDALNPRMSRED